jgi:hypothetical protein
MELCGCALLPSIEEISWFITNDLKTAFHNVELRSKPLAAPTPAVRVSMLSLVQASYRRTRQ